MFLWFTQTTKIFLQQKFPDQLIYKPHHAHIARCCCLKNFMSLRFEGWPALLYAVVHQQFAVNFSLVMDSSQRVAVIMNIHVFEIKCGNS